MFKFQEVILESEKEQTRRFLESNGLKYESNVEYTLNYFDDNKLIGTVSVFNNVLKCLLIDDNYKGNNIANVLVSKGIEYIFNNGYENVFVYTKHDNINIFTSMNFHEIITTEYVCLLEYNSNIENSLMKIKDQYGLNKESYAAIVMNCNPMTNGHLYLISKCSELEENVIVFVVEEDQSYFKFSDRFKIVKEECSVFSNVTVVPSSKYSISASTFPTYFIKDEIIDDSISIELDLKIFDKYFCKVFNITKRYFGTEPYSELTNQYNLGMKKYLKNWVEIERIKHGDIYVSATYVRKLIEGKNLEEISRLVPKSTYKLITSKYI